MVTFIHFLFYYSAEYEAEFLVDDDRIFGIQYLLSKMPFSVDHYPLDLNVCLHVSKI